MIGKLVSVVMTKFGVTKKHLNISADYGYYQEFY